MKLSVDDYYLAYTDGKRELEIHLAGPTAISEVLASVHIQAWENPIVTINGRSCPDLSTLVTDQDEVHVSGGRL